MRPLLVALVLLTSGCMGLTPASTAPDVSDATSEVRFDTILAEALPYTADDGVVLDNHVFRPDTDEPVPVIINFSPYWHNLAAPAATGGDAFSLYLIDHFVPRGYAVVLASARGTGLSEGCFTIGGPREIEDVDQTITFFGEQPWSSGAVAAVAKSYDGTMAQAALTRENAYLKTIVPVSPISEFYKYNYAGGVPYTVNGQVFNTYYVAETSLAQGIDVFGPSVAPDPAAYERTATRFCSEAVDVQAAQYHSAATGDYSAYWQARNYTALLPDAIGASVFYVHGLQDWNVKPDHMVPWIDELRSRDVLVKMQLGQWGHDYSHRSDWNSTLLRWFDSELKGMDNGIRAEPLVQVQDTDEVWRFEEEWPVARAMPLVLFPDADGSLGAEPGSGSAAYGDAPGGILQGAADLTFTAKPSERALRITGAPTLTLTVSSTGPRGTIAAALLLDGKVVDQGFLEIMHRNGLETSEPATPGESYQVTIPFYPQDIVVPAGSVLSLVVSSTAPPGAPVDVVPFGAGALMTVTFGEGSMISIPVIDADDVRIEEPQPEDVGCWTC